MAVEDFRDHLQQKFPLKYGRADLLALEVHYEKWQPFMGAWILYLLASFLFGLSQFKTKPYYKIGWIFLVLGLLVHTYGMGLRILIQQRPPIGTMYETVIWVPWIAMLCAMVLEFIKRRKLV